MAAISSLAIFSVTSGEVNPAYKSFVEGDNYYRAVLLLFRPHRETTFLDDRISPRDAYLDFRRSSYSQAISELLDLEENLVNYYRSQ